MCEERQVASPILVVSGFSRTIGALLAPSAECEFEQA